MAKKYKNIPVEEEVYIRVKALAEANGFGERGVGAQVADWVKRELPECEHEKTPIVIEEFYNGGANKHPIKRTGWYCATCRRAYQYVLTEQLVEAVYDPYLNVVGVKA
jgi:hypothetical protein